MSKAKLKIFKYIDLPVVNQFLAQVEGGEVDEQQFKDSSGRTSGIGATASFGPLGGSAERSKESSSETEFVLRRTGPAKFNQLHAVLARDHELVELMGLDDEAWAEVEVGEILEFKVEISIAPFFVDLLQMREISKLAPMIEAFESLGNLGLPGVQMDAKARAGLGQAKSVMPAAGEIAEQLGSGPIPCTFRPVATPSIEMFAFLDQANLIINAADLPGEATVLVKVDRLVEPRKPHRVSVVQGMPTASREQRRKGPAKGELTLRHPGALVTVVAAY